MKLNRISVEGYQKITNLDIDIRAQILFVAGANEAGKTSLADAIRHTFIGEAGRVKLKKDFGDLVNDEFKQGVVSLEWSRGGNIGGSSLVIPAGTRTSDLEPTTAHQCLFDFRHFTSMPANDRRSLIFGMSKVRLNGATIRDKLIAAAASPAKVEAIAPILLAGFEAAEKQAKANVSEARGAWKATTGEAYGSVKAVTWKAAAMDWSLAAIETAQAMSDMAGELVNEANIDLGKLIEHHRTAATMAQTKAWTESAGTILRIETKLEKDEAELVEWTVKVDDTRAKASGARVDTSAMNCPHCAGLVVLRHGKLQAYESPQQVADPEAIRNLPIYEASLSTMRSAVDNDKRDLKASKLARDKLKEIGNSPTKEALEDELASERKRIKTLVDSLTDARKNLDAELAKKDAALKSSRDTDKAAGYHNDVQDWDAIAALLAPSGIQSQMTTEALTPLRERLQSTAKATGWHCVTIDDDMTVRIGGRPYSLNSQSAKWRADVAITEAISFISKEQFFMVDEVDVLDLTNRAALLKWLHGLANNGQIDTVLVAGTLKELPLLPPTFQTEWLQNGALRVALREAA